MKRIVLALVALVLVGVVVAVVLLVSNLDSIVESAIEKYGSAMTGTAVRVGSVEIDLSKGTGAIRDVTIANPAGFPSSSAFRLGEIALAIDAGSLAKRAPVVIDSIAIRAPEVTLELDSAGRSNLMVIRDNLKRYEGGGGAEESGAPSGEATRLAVKRFVFEKGEVNVLASAVGGGDKTVELPPLRMTDLGGRRGATGAELGKTVLSAYTETVLKKVASQELGRVLEDKLGGKGGEAARKLLRDTLD